jgi:hypothetical protein
MTNAGKDPDRTDDATASADEGDAEAAHQADRPPTAEEEAAAERAETGANIEGEGQI